MDTTLKNKSLQEILIPKNASWVIRKILEARTWITQNPMVDSGLKVAFARVMQGNSFSIHKMYKLLMPQYPRVAWKNLTLHNKIHPRLKFIIWLAVQHRLATVPQLIKFGIQVPTECIFCGQELETLEHLFFECDKTHNLWQRLCNWIGFRRVIQD